MFSLCMHPIRCAMQDVRAGVRQKVARKGIDDNLVMVLGNSDGRTALCGQRQVPERGVQA